MAKVKNALAFWCCTRRSSRQQKQRYIHTLRSRDRATTPHLLAAATATTTTTSDRVRHHLKIKQRSHLGGSDSLVVAVKLYFLKDLKTLKLSYFKSDRCCQQQQVGVDEWQDGQEYHFDDPDLATIHSNIQHATFSVAVAALIFPQADNFHWPRPRQDCLSVLLLQQHQQHQG